MTAGSPPPFRLGYLPQLDGLRAAAVLAVIALHADLSFARGGAVGVDLFFSLSGFLITTLLLAEFDRTGTVSLGAFYMRRVLRLYPALLVLLAVTFLFVSAHPLALSPEFGQRRMIYGSLVVVTYTSDVIITFTHVAVGPYFHTWSLAIEEHFYLVWPIVVIAMLRRRLPRHSILVIILLLMVACFTWRLALWRHGGDPLHLRYSFDTQADQPLMGCALAFAVPWLAPGASGRVGHKVLSAAGLVGAAVLAWFIVRPLSASALADGGYVLIYLASGALLISLVLGSPLFIGSLLRVAPVVYVGRISYGLYLWHFVVFHALTASALGASRAESIVVRLAVTFLLAAVSHRLVERPVLRFKARRFQPRVHSA